MKPSCYNQMDSTERKIYNSVENFTIANTAKAKDVFAQTGIKPRMLAARVRGMNEKYKGHFFIGSLREGYWLCRDREEAVESVLGYNRIIMSMLGERKRMKAQIDETFPTGEKNLFGESINPEITIPKKDLYNPFLER